MKKYYKIITYLLTFTFSHAENSGYEIFENVSLLYKFYNEPKTWYEATRICRESNSRLAMPVNAQEAELLSTIFSRHLHIQPYDMEDGSNKKLNINYHQYLFLGFHSMYADGEFVTESDSSIENYYHLWANSHEGLQDTRGCGGLNKDAKLVYTECEEYSVFICQRPFVTEYTQLHTFGHLVSCEGCETGPLYRWNSAWVDSLWTRGEIDPKHSSVSICENNTSLMVTYKDNETLLSLKLNKGYKIINDMKKVYKIHLNPQMWSQARSICEAENAHLAIVENEKEVSALIELMNEHRSFGYNLFDNYVLIGFHSLLNKKVPLTIMGDIFNPNIPWKNDTYNALFNHCGAIVRSGQLSHFPCHIKTIFICEKEVFT